MRLVDWILRFLILAGMGILFVPSIKLPKPGKRPHLIVLIDGSRSMSDPYKQLQLNEIGNDINAVQSLATKDVFQFSDSVAPVGNLSKVRFEGHRTDIGAALDLLKPGDADMILLISDGRHNGPDQPVTKQRPVPIYGIVIGENDLPDIGIDEVSYLDSSRVRVRLRSNIEESILTRLDMYRGTDRIATRKIKLSSDGLTEFTLPVPADPEGSLRFELDSLPGEDRLDNNSFVFYPTRRVNNYRAQFVAGMITQETELILHELGSIPGIELSTYIEIAPGKIAQNGSPKPDVLIVGPLGGKTSKEVIQHITDTHSENVPIMFISALYQAPNELSPIMPMIKTRSNLNPSPPWQRTPFAEILLSDWQPEAGINNDTLRELYAAKPETDVLLGKNKASFIVKSETPVRILGIEIPSITQAVDADEEGFSKFIKAALTFLIEGPGFPFSFEVAEASSASLRIDLFSQIETSGTDIQAWLMPDSHSLNTTPLSSQSLRLTGTPTAGSYKLHLQWNGQEFLPKGGIEVTNALPEESSRGVNYQLMSYLVERNSGHLINSDELRDIVESLPRKKTIDFKPIKTPYLVILVGILFLVEIWHRRKKGLP